MTFVHFSDDLLLFRMASTKAIPVIPSSRPGKSHPLIPPEHRGWLFLMQCMALKAAEYMFENAQIRPSG